MRWFKIAVFTMCMTFIEWLREVRDILATYIFDFKATWLQPQQNTLKWWIFLIALTVTTAVGLTQPDTFIIGTALFIGTTVWVVRGLTHNVLN